MDAPAFHSAYAQGFTRVAACTTPVRIADPATNARTILDAARACDARGVAVAVFPELCLTGYAIDDLLLQDALLDAAVAALAAVAEGSRDLLPVLVVGLPLRRGARLYNTAAIVHRGRVLGLVPKVHLPNYREFYEKRHFASGAGETGGTVRPGGPFGATALPFGTDLVFEAEDVANLVLGVEVCEDMFVPVPPAAGLALAGATVIANPSGSPITVGRAAARDLLAASTSARCLCAYVYAAAGPGESTTDLSWDGETAIFEVGATLAAGDRFPEAAQITVADVDLDLVVSERRSMGSFDDNRRALPPAPPWRRIGFRLDPPRGDIGLERAVDRFPFVPDEPARLAQDCYEAYSIQVSGLAQRLAAIGAKTVTIGVSGGLDSTHALIVTAKAFDRLGLSRKDILAFTLPGFATGDETKANAHRLMAALGTTARELDIRPAARQMLADLGHPFAAGEPVHDVTFENVQAGLRTDYLFRLANQSGGIVIGTGDLSELALGWCTYGVGDQMAHYNVNSGVPKTLIQHLIRWVIASGQFEAEANATLGAILGTEISPELVPVAAGEKPQSTQGTIGPYALQDFNLFYTLRYGFRPSRIAFLAHRAWGDSSRGAWPAGFPEAEREVYDLATIKRWLTVFVRRFFGFAQFKRSAMPNGPKVAAGGALSPRGDWRAPSDGNADVWLADLARVPDA